MGLTRKWERELLLFGYLPPGTGKLALCFAVMAVVVLAIYGLLVRIFAG